MKGNALLFAGEARVGDTLSLPAGGELTLRGTPFWARLRGSHDPALWLAYAGFALVMAGAALVFIVVKVDGCVVVTPVGACERVFVGLKPQRLAPLFQERFEQLVRSLGGPDTPHMPSQAQAGAAGAVNQAAPRRVVTQSGHVPAETDAGLLRRRMAGWPRVMWSTK